MKLAVVVQRYGADISGGAELHARYIAEHLARHVETEVVTTCARDYITWRNELDEGADEVNGVPVRRFRVAHERDVERFSSLSRHVFERRHSLDAELRWLESEGPASPALVSYLGHTRQRYDFFIFFSYRYYHAYHGIRNVAAQAILVPTAERDAAIGLSMFKPMFRGVRALMYNSPEERAMIQAVSGNADVPGVVVGVGSNVPETADPNRFRQMYGISGRYAIYVGRIDENKGCRELFDFFQRYLRATGSVLTLVLGGHTVLPIPPHPRIRHVGFLDDRDKFDAMAGAELLVMPSYYESLSMVALEAWALGRPVLANGRCDVLKGQCIRSNAGLYYENYVEFEQTLLALESNAHLRSALGRRGREFFTRHYAWPVIERKYLDVLELIGRENRDRSARSGIEPLPGWMKRRRSNLPPASDVVAALPSGAVLD